MASGSIEKRVTNSGKTIWGAVIDIGPDPVIGKRRQRRLSAPTKRELETMVQETRTNVQRGMHIEPSKQTVREYLEEWLGAVEGTLRPASYVRYQRALKNHALPALGGVRLASLTPARIQKFYHDLAKQGLSPSTIELYHNIFHRAFDKAVVWRLIPHNPCDAVDAPHATVGEMQTWNPTHARTFLIGTVEDKWAALWRLAVMVGMRRGELLALRWADLDLDQGTLAVRRTITRGKDGLIYNEPKSKAGRRSIALPSSCVKALRQHRAQQAKHRLTCGSAWQDNDLVFDAGLGAGISFSVIHRAFKRISAALDLPDIRLHDLRHTAATLALSQGIHPKVVQEMLGHSDISMTLNRYSHVSMTMQREAADRMDAALGA